MEIENLTQVEHGKTLTVIKIDGGHHFNEKIEAMGLRNGVTIQKLSTQILNGPVTIKIGSTKIALGYGMAKRIFVQVKK